jgi:hypothetical protein
VDAGIGAAQGSHDPQVIGRAIDQAVADLSFSLPQGKKAQVTDALVEIAKAHVRLKLTMGQMTGEIDQAQLVDALMDVTGRKTIVPMQ